MKKEVSVFAFSPYVLADGARTMLVEGDRKVRPVMSKGQVIAPLAFFEQALTAEISVDGGKITLCASGHTLTAAEGAKAYAADGTAGEYSVPVRKEKDRLCLPVVETAHALGMTARQYGQLAVIAPEETLDSLSVDEEALKKLTQKTCGVYNAAYFTKEDFYQAREAWRRYLCGDEETNDPTIPGIQNILEMRDRESERMRREMHREKDAVILFGTEAPTESSDLRTQYGHILHMALPYGTVGCRGYKSKELLDDILYALDWMHDNMYGAKVLSNESYRSYKIFNWWEWYVGGACPMLDTVMLVSDDIDRKLVNKYVLPMSFIRTQMRVELRPELGLSRILPLTPLSLLTEDRALLQANYVDEVALLEEHDDGDNMRRDWCCMTHAQPYNLGYGCCNLDRVALIMKILEDSPLAFTLPKKYSLMQMARYTFAPCMYQGRGSSMMNGRSMQDNAGPLAMIGALRGFKNLMGLFGDEEDRELYEIIHRNATPQIRKLLIGDYDTDRPLSEYELSIWDNVHIATYGQFRDALTNDKYAAAPYQLGYMWYSGDCATQFRHDYMLALRMNSERLPGYESINGQNKDAWYTGDGMLYLFAPDSPEQYDVRWWKGVSKYLMPGTTVEDRPRQARSIRYNMWYKSSKDFVGGVDLAGQYVTASMDLESFHNDSDPFPVDDSYGVSNEIFDCTLTAQKCWFMMDRAVAAIGAEVNAQDDYDVRTVIESRLLDEQGLEGILVNGAPINPDLTQETRSDVKSVYLPKMGAYYFPQGGEITFSVCENNGEKFIYFWFEHGRKPAGGKYVYIVLPNATAEEYAAYDVSDIEILRNDGQIQAVREKHSGLTGIVFREAGTYEGITADQPMIVMTQKTESGLSLTACDPTQKREAFSLSVLGAKEAVSCDARTTVEAAEGGVKLSISCDASRGRGYRAELKI